MLWWILGGAILFFGALVGYFAWQDRRRWGSMTAMLEQLEKDDREQDELDGL